MKSQQELSDRLEIQDQITAYSYAIDLHDWDALDDIFTPDASLDFTASGGERGTRDELKPWLATSLDLFDGHQHLMGNTRVQFGADGDTATSQTMCLNPMPLTHDGRQQLVLVGIWYADEWVRTPQGWRITNRVQQKGFLHGLPAS
ncbi:MAG TPA: nuclear transport factor 2 family protein [Jatrophihabitantaceae bacterium]|nr:nuclear transport factor 2 family protein [Jatrophihabitantaceae bacterium]